MHQFWLQHYFIELSRTNPCIVSRSIMQILYMPENGKVLGTSNIVDVLRDTARNFICPPVLSVRSVILNKDEVWKATFRDILCVDSKVGEGGRGAACTEKKKIWWTLLSCKIEKIQENGDCASFSQTLFFCKILVFFIFFLLIPPRTSERSKRTGTFEF